MAGVAALGALAIPVIVHMRESPPAEMRLEIVTPPTRQPLSFALSPDGRYVVFVASGQGSDDPDRLYLRRLDRSDATPMAETDGAQLPFWSPDSRTIGFFAHGRLHRIDVAGGPPRALAAAAAPLGGSWGPDDTILFAPNTVSPLFRVSADGGDAAAATKLDAPRRSSHLQPSFLPDGRRFLFFCLASDAEVAGLYLGSIDGATPKRLTAADSGGAYLVPDRVIFMQRTSLVARQLDLTAEVMTGDPVTLAASVSAFSTSATGLIAHRVGARNQFRMMWFDRSGRALGDLDTSINGPDLSADGERLVGDRTVDGNRDVWVIDLARGGRTRFTSDPAVDGYPVISPDGSRIVFESNRTRTFDLWTKPSSGAGADELLFETPDDEWPVDWSRDSRFLLFQRSDLRAAWDLWALPMTGSNRTPIAVANSRFAERMGEFSPDGRWVVYETDESGRPEIVAQAFPQAGGKWPVSTTGGAAPRWSADGKEIYYVAPDGKLMAVAVKRKERRS
jgi:Tol biopolymer transport system component